MESTPPPERRCNRCGRYKVLNGENFPYDRNAKWGLGGICRVCCRLRARENNPPAPEWIRALEYWGYRCAVCGWLAPNTLYYELERDHWDNSQKGKHKSNNLIPLCRSCNASKSDRNALDWLLWKFGDRGAEIAQRINVYLEWIKELDG